MSHFVTFGSSGYYSSGCSLHTLQFPEKFGGIRIMLISKSFSGSSKNYDHIFQVYIHERFEVIRSQCDPSHFSRQMTVGKRECD